MYDLSPNNITAVTSACELLSAEKWDTSQDLQALYLLNSVRAKCTLVLSFLKPLELPSANLRTWKASGKWLTGYVDCGSCPSLWGLWNKYMRTLFFQPRQSRLFFMTEPWDYSPGSDHRWLSPFPATLPWASSGCGSSTGSSHSTFIPQIMLCWLLPKDLKSPRLFDFLQIT